MKVLKRGTTPVHTFKLPFESQEGTRYRIVYAQGEERDEAILFERTNESCNIDGDTISIKLTTAETLLFDCTPHHFNGRYEPYPVKIQLGARTLTGDVFWSNIMNTTIERVLREDCVV